MNVPTMEVLSDFAMMNFNNACATGIVLDPTKDRSVYYALP